MISEHYKETKSKVSEKIIKDFEKEVNMFYQICPKEMLDKLKYPVSNKNIKDLAV